MFVASFRRSFFAIALGVAAWTAGCASAPRPAIEPAFAARTYTPIHIALLPPDVFMVLDQVGDNDPARSEALRRQVIDQVVRLSSEAFRSRGYDLNLSARWDGVFGPDGQPLVSGDELAGMADAILQFANGPVGGQQGPLVVPQIIAPELAAKIGWATQSDSLLYVNLKGVTTSNGKRAAAILGAVFIALIVVLLVVATSKSSGHGNSAPIARGPGRAVAGPRMRGGAPVASGMRGGAPIARGPVPVGRGSRFAGGPAPRYYGGGPRMDVGVGVFIPLEGPTYTHEGQVEYEDSWFGDDELYLNMTLVNAADGRVLWQVRHQFDADADDPKDLQEMVNQVVGTLPPRGDLEVPSAAVHCGRASAIAAPATASAATPDRLPQPTVRSLPPRISASVSSTVMSAVPCKIAGASTDRPITRTNVISGAKASAYTMNTVVPRSGCWG